MRNLITIILGLLIISCAKEKQYDLTVKGTIKNLKKGTIYLQKIKDSTLVNVDSMVINVQKEFLLHSNLNSPEVFYLHLNKTNEDSQRKIPFFADKGITEINATLKDFPFKHTIKGSSQQEKYTEFKNMITQFNNKNIDIIKAQLEAQVSGDTAEANAKTKEVNNLLKSKYRYAINFAINNKDSEVAPYIALSEIYDTNITYLDTIYKSLPKHIASSKYGVELDKFIKQRKEEDNQ